MSKDTAGGMAIDRPAMARVILEEFFFLEEPTGPGTFLPRRPNSVLTVDESDTEDMR